jgi:hypothetical protein
MHLELWIPPCILFGWWFSPWELCVVQLVDIAVLPMGLQSSSAPSVLPLTFPLGSLDSVWLLAVTIWICISQVLAETLRRQPYQAPDSKHFLASAIVSGFDVCRWNGSLGGAVSGWPFLQTLFHFFFFCTCLSFGQEHFWVNNFEMGGWPHPSTRGCAYLLEMVLSPLCSVFWLISSIWVLGASHVPGLWDFLVVTPRSPSPSATHFYSISWLSVFLSYLFQYLILPPFIPPPSSLPPRFLSPSTFCDYFVPPTM